MAERWIFRGHIAGVGTASGLRAVVGLWDKTPFGPFSDVMVELPSGHRVLLAPDPETAAFIEGTYDFDEIRVLKVGTRLNAESLEVDAGPLHICAGLGARTGLGQLLARVPRRLAVHPWWLRAVNPAVARISPGTQTAGEAKDGRREFYGVTDLVGIDSAVVSWEGKDAGGLRDITPAVRFGFSSMPPRPSLATVQTTVQTTVQVHPQTGVQKP
ncbi:hypothetical protein IV498_08280 [Paenarthrobacter sp. Z7-10]|uniref:hypothetical protein n=1 Tax=Paenarthrobacter sp. Z7-10 TaxID=2787635 RepID=UPI0022A9A038|nr:hypothetical protein [Paenarthrobacter sp. Z7-10]MCZ2403178.1 hypothetical protein [Paenarthrobacter sp. Z7-10]